MIMFTVAGTTMYRGELLGITWVSFISVKTFFFKIEPILFDMKGIAEG